MYFTFVVLFQNVVYIRNTVDVDQSGQLFYFKYWNSLSFIKTFFILAH